MTDKDIEALARERHSLCEKLDALQEHGEATKEPHEPMIAEILEQIRSLEARLQQLLTTPVWPETPKKP